MQKVKKSQHKNHKPRFTVAGALAVGLVTAGAVFSGHGFGLISANTLGSTDFADVPEDNKNAVAIDFLQKSEVIKGYEDGSFKPEGGINRAELMKILVEAQGVTPDPDEYKDCFPDVKDEWFAPYVCYAKEMEWVGGYADGTFGAEKPVIKVEAIKMTINSQGLSGETQDCDTELFADTNKAEWYGKYLCVAKNKGLLEEGATDSYNPTEAITRGTVSENIYRAITIEKLEKKVFNEAVKKDAHKALEEFKADKEKIREEIQTFKEELKQMKHEGLSEEEIKEQRKEFWGEVKIMQKENIKELGEQLRETREEFKEERGELKELLDKCSENCDKVREEFKFEHQRPVHEPNKGPHQRPEHTERPEKTPAVEPNQSTEVKTEEVKPEETQTEEVKTEETKTEETQTTEEVK